MNFEPVLCFSVSRDENGDCEIYCNEEITNNLPEESYENIVHWMNEILQDYDDDNNDDNKKDTLTSDEFNDIDVLRRDGCYVINDECPICLEPFEGKDYIKRLSCQHGFHQKCAKDWLVKVQPTCPMCRDKIK
jgi:uncharacterized C2H2 Zn-finger protein